VQWIEPTNQAKPESAHSDPRGWSTLPKLIVYHLDKTLTDPLAEIGPKPRDVAHVAQDATNCGAVSADGLIHGPEGAAPAVVELSIAGT
jgi:hypothetical protein